MLVRKLAQGQATAKAPRSWPSSDPQSIMPLYICRKCLDSLVYKTMHLRKPAGLQIERCYGVAGESRVHLGPQNLLSSSEPTHRVQDKY